MMPQDQTKAAAFTNPATYREERGRQIAKRGVRRAGSRYTVPSQSGGAAYVVDLVDETCTCPDYEARRVRCKHQHAVLFWIAWEQSVDADGNVTETVKVTRKTYRQNWPAYHEAQVNEKADFEPLLSGLCDGIVQPPQTMGRPRLPLRDEVYALVHKVYCTVSGRRAQTDLRNCLDRGYVSSAPSYNSMFRATENPAITPILRTLIEEAALPLRNMESQFAQDATGFSTVNYDRWYDQKHGTLRARHGWVKLHALTGTLTNVIVNATVTDGDANDSPFLEPMVAEAAAHGFKIDEVSADKAYLSHDNVKAIRAVGATPFISFKVNSTGRGPAEWREMFAFFALRQPEFLDHYHRRSNVESTFWMVKSKFGGSVRSKLPVAQANEVYGKAICHNLACIISAMYETGLKPDFLSEAA